MKSQSLSFNPLNTQKKFKTLEYFVGQEIEIDVVVKDLFSFGYKKVSKVSLSGEIANRGGVIDIFPIQYDCPVRLDFESERIDSIKSINLQTHETLWEHKIILIFPNRQSQDETFLSTTPLNTFVDIEKGDYVVHDKHGIARFLGLTPIEHNQKLSEHFVLEYSQGDKLFVPKHDIHLIQKYVGFTKKPPRLYKLGSKEWQRVKNLIQKRIQHFAAELLHTQAMRASLSGYQYAKDTPWQLQFEEAFPFEETADQLKATQAVKEDMESFSPMDRLLCGDVGYGKTEVAMRATFKAVMDGKQVAILVPTTILAEQHYFNFKKRVKDFPVEVGMLSRFKTKAQQQEIIKNLASGKIDVIIGTHRLLSKDISFKDLGLLIIDEEQRFGVKAKERLKQFRLLLDVLMLTATPIPRTLYLAMAGARDMSVIATPPQKRLPVETDIVEFDELLIKEAIQRELKRAGQVFFLHNRVHDIDKMERLIHRLVPQARVAVGHGQMPARLLESIMLKFFAGQIDVLICTTIIESGIDIPNANTLIVNRADRLGLADLHQLRGRVGRYNKKAYAYFIVPKANLLSYEAKSRIKALEKYSQLGAGFHIAFEDLQIRGAGNILGAQQHGYVTTVGFDLYCRLLKESVENLKKMSLVTPEVITSS